MLGPFATASRFTLSFTRGRYCRHCRTPPAHRCPRRRLRRRQQQRQRQRVTEGTAMALWNEPNKRILYCSKFHEPDMRESSRRCVHIGRVGEDVTSWMQRGNCSRGIPANLSLWPPLDRLVTCAATPVRVGIAPCRYLRLMALEPTQ